MEPNLKEVFHYLGAKEPMSEDFRHQVTAVSRRLFDSIQPRFLYKVFPLLHEDGQIQIPDAGITLTGQLSQKMLATCDLAVLMACTLGTAFDAMLRTEQARNMADAVILDACGNALVEAGCDAAEEEIKARFPARFLTDRFSPGYGDLGLHLQPVFCTALDTRRRLGIHVTSSYLLNPSKSVTALIGLSDKPQMARIRGCAYCSMRETCTLRKGGKCCAT